MFRENKLAKYLIVSCLLHIIAAAAMSRIYAEQPQRRMMLEIKSAVRIQYEEPVPPPKPKIVAAVQPKKVAPKKEEPKPKKEPKITPQEVEAPKVTRQRREMGASAPSLGAGTAQRQSISRSGVAGIRGARGPVDELPTVQAAGGIADPNLVTKTGGTGLTPGLTHGSMATPEGSGYLPGQGGKEVAGFRFGTAGTGSGVGNVNVSGSGGRGGRANDGPGTGLGSFAGKVNTGAGRGTTGLGVGEGDGMEKMDAESSGSKPGEGAGEGGTGEGKGGPGLGGHQTSSSRAEPGLPARSGSKTTGAKELPGTESIPEQKRDGATGKEEFKADVGTNMTSASRTIEKPDEPGLEGVLQAEINRNVHGLRKMYEDWQNLKIPNVPKALQITVELGAEGGKPKLLKLDLHNPGLSPRIKDDLTEKIKTWKFRSLFDGKDDPGKWPIKLTGIISWQK